MSISLTPEAAPYKYTTLSQTKERDCSCPLNTPHGNKWQITIIATWIELFINLALTPYIVLGTRFR